MDFVSGKYAVRSLKRYYFRRGNIKQRSIIPASALAFGLAFGSFGLSAQAETVTVQSGDTLWEIAQEQNMTVNELEEMNPDLNPYTLQIGAEVVISGESDNSTGSIEEFHTIQPGETLSSIANLHAGVTLADLFELNPGIDPYNLQIGSEVRVEASSQLNGTSGEIFHTIEPGETLISIANLHAGVTLDELYDWNPGIDPYSLQIGSEVRVAAPQ